MANNQLFRQKSVDRISSPEQMRDYMKVTSPKLWMILSAIVLLLAGFIVYASTTRMESAYTLKMQVYGTSYVYGEIPYEEMELVSVGMPLRIGEYTGKVMNIVSSARIKLDVTLDSKAELADGYYIMTIGENTEVNEEAAEFVSYNFGIFTTSNMNFEDYLSSGEIRVRLWSYDVETETYTGGRLATVSGAEAHVIASVDAVLEGAQENALPEGVYDAEIVTENTTPISFLLN